MGHYPWQSHYLLRFFCDTDQYSKDSCLSISDGKIFPGCDVPATRQSWDAFFQLLLIYNIIVGLVISFINQVNKKYGPGVLLPLLLGKYRKPKEEERIFLFMDLKSSTSIAESLGHFKYSSFIRDSFMDINTLLPKYNAQIYQYVGDEIVFTWTIKEGLKKFFCIQFFFACEERFNTRSSYYLNIMARCLNLRQGFTWEVTAVEVGDIKRDIAYHGDTLNTAARIQSVCNLYNRNFLTSSFVLENTKIEKYFKTESIGMVELKGKHKPVEIASISRRRLGMVTTKIAIKIFPYPSQNTLLIRAYFLDSNKVHG